MLNYCILTPGGEGQYEQNKNSVVGFYQWLKAFQGKILKPGQVLPVLRNGKIDIVHIHLTRKTLVLTDMVRSIIGYHSRTKLVVHVDIPVEYWAQEFPATGLLARALAQSDMAAAVQYPTARKLEEICRKPVFTIPHPADIRKIKAMRNGINRSKLTILCRSEQRIGFLSRLIAALLGLQIQIISNPVLDPFGHSSNNGSEIKSAADLAGSRVIVIPYPGHDFGYEILYAAALECLVLGHIDCEIMRRCFPYSVNDVSGLSGYLRMYAALKNKQGFIEFLKNYASAKVEYYNIGNMRKRFLDNLFRATKDTRFTRAGNTAEPKDSGTIFYREIRHTAGLNKINPRTDEFCVVCLVKNGEDYITPFLRHYRDIGCKTFIFIDNGSSDETTRLLKAHDDVLLYETDLDFAYYESDIRRTVIEEHCKGRWCLCVDIDELFEYPCSDVISMNQFLHYLSLHKYTAVIACMLDMFRGDGSRTGTPATEDIVEKYCYYDNTESIKKAGYFTFSKSFCYFNTLADENMQYCYGGIRGKHFKTPNSIFLLTKHPLMFIDHKIEPVVNPHYCDKAHIADVTCLLRHYKFISSAKKRIMNTASHHYDYYAAKEFETYNKVFKEKNDTQFYSTRSKKYNSVNDFVDNGLLRLSRRYKNYVEDFKNTQHTPG